MAYTSGAHIFGKAMLLATALCGGVSGPALAETYEISGVYSETAFAPVLARRIAIGQFDGELGVQFSYIMERALADIYINEERHFDMVAEGGGTPSDAILSGMATSWIDVVEVSEERTQCADRNGNGKCVRSETVQIVCEKFVVSVSAGVRVARSADDRIVYSDIKQRDQEQTYCPDRSTTTLRPEQLVDASLRQLSRAFRTDLAPVEISNSIRLKETTKGLSRARKQEFRRAIALSKTDPDASCDAMFTLSQAEPSYPAILFNSGLCAERAGDRSTAMEYYRRAQTSSQRSGHIEAAFARIQNHDAAAEFLLERNSTK